MALDIITSINLDMKAPNAEVVYANQYDSAGHVVAQLLNDGEKWLVPSGAKSIVSYRKSDRIGGYYDTTEFGETAVSIASDRSIVTISLDQQTMTTFGPVYMQVNFLQDDKRLSTFEFLLQVKKSPIVQSNVESKWFVKLMSVSGIVVDDTLSILGNAADAKKTGDKIRAANTAIEQEVLRAVNAEATKVNKPQTSPNGTNGQLLRTNGDGTTQWSDVGTPTDAQVGTAVDTWLTEHPEATTTVQDGTISKQKLTADLADLADDTKAVLDETIAAFLHQDDAECLYPEYGYSACTVIHNSNTCIIYDFGEDGAQKVVSYLVANGISKVDAVIVSHYHPDHCSTVSVDGFIDGCETNNIDISSCVWYLPHYGIDWTRVINSSISSVEPAVKSMIENAGMTYILPTTEGQAVTIGNIPVKFYNLNTAWYNEYYEWMFNEDNVAVDYSNYNNFSMCASFTLGSSKMFLTGDIMLPAQERMAYAVKNADCVLVPHHGLNCRESEAFMSNMNCRIGVVPAFYADRYKLIKHGLRPITARCKELGIAASTIDSDVRISFSNAGMHLLTDNGYDVTGKAVGQMLFDDENLDNIGYGVFYTFSAARSANIENWPTIYGSKMGAAKIYSIVSSSGSSELSGTVQIAVATYDRYAKVVYRKKETVGGVATWSPWMPIDGAIFTKGNTYQANVFGWVTNDGKDLTMVAPVAINTINTRSIKTSITSLVATIRIPTGGYVVNGSNITEYIATAELQSSGRGIYFRCNKSDGWDVTNNIPISGIISVIFSDDIM